MTKDIRYIIKRVIIGVLIILVMSFINSCEVHAEMIKIEQGDVTINNSNLPYQITTQANANSSLNYNLLVNWNGMDKIPAYVVTTACSTGDPLEIVRTYGQGQSCPNSCFDQNITYFTTYERCNTSTFFGIRYYIIGSIKKWDVGSGNTQYWRLIDSISLKNSMSYGISTTIESVFWSDDALIEAYQNAKTQQELRQVQSMIQAQTSQQHQDNINTQDAINDVNDSINDSSTASNQDFNDAINSVKNSLPTNSTISSLITMPITFLQKIIDALNGTCTPITIGELYEYNMTMPCINPVDYIGIIWNIIDIISAGFFAYYFGKKLVLLFHNITSMKEGGLKEAYD